MQTRAGHGEVCHRTIYYVDSFFEPVMTNNAILLFLQTISRFRGPWRLAPCSQGVKATRNIRQVICNFDYDCLDEDNMLKNFYYGHDYHIIQLLLVLIRTSY